MVDISDSNKRSIDNFTKTIISLNLKEILGDYACTDKEAKILIDEKALFHIKEHHRNEFTRLCKNMVKTLEIPDYVIENEKNRNTVIFIRKINERLSQIVVLRLGKKQCYVKTSYSVSHKRIVVLLKNAKILYVR